MCIKCLPVEFAAKGFRLPSGDPNKCVADNLVCLFCIRCFDLKGKQKGIKQ